MGNTGVGMPSALLVEQFGRLVRDAFDGEMPYQVGSSLETTKWRDVDVRLILDDETYAARGFGDPERPHSNAKWVAYTLAFSALGKQMTGLPIDFQVQQRTHANAKHDGPRSAIGIRDLVRFDGDDMTASPPTTAPVVGEEKRNAPVTNQCDGCRRGIPVVDGIHHDEQVMGMMCTADRYANAPLATQDEIREWTRDVDDAVDEILRLRSALATLTRERDAARVELREEKTRGNRMFDIGIHHQNRANIAERELAFAADVFDEYAAKHEANGTPEGDEKAKSNRLLATRFRSVVTSSSNAPTDEQVERAARAMGKYEYPVLQYAAVWDALDEEHKQTYRALASNILTAALTAPPGRRDTGEER